MYMEKQVYSVTQLNNYIKNMVQSDFFLSHVCIRGEVSNYRGAGASGHIYFTLKDDGGEVSVAMWRSKRGGIKGEFKNGDSVIVTGSVDVYPPRGTYQIIASTIEPQGLGDLFVRFEALKKELSEMGMFAEEYKKPVPEYINTLGVVTAETGAAVRDIIKTAKSRNPYVRIILSPALVQGDGAAASIVSAIERLDALHPDVMIVGRGGGSIEDLWAFNEESVARAIFEAETPVISAVGHETDTTIADFVADKRAHTPTAAAEMAVFSYSDFEDRLEGGRDRLCELMERRLGYVRLRLLNDSQRLKAKSPDAQLLKLKSDMRTISLGLKSSMERILALHRRRLAVFAERLDGRSPAKKLSAGYAFVKDGEGKRLRSVEQVKKGDRITLNVSDGEIVSEVCDVR